MVSKTDDIIADKNTKLILKKENLLSLVETLDESLAVSAFSWKHDEWLIVREDVLQKLTGCKTYKL